RPIAGWRWGVSQAGGPAEHSAPAKAEAREQGMNYSAGRMSRRTHGVRIVGMAEHSRGSVLVVDDEPTIAEVVARYLERAGYRTRIAADGLGAIDAAAEQRPDLVVLDLMLPGIDGLEVMRRLR